MSRLHRLLAASFGLALSVTAFVGPFTSTSAHAASPSANAATFIKSEVVPGLDDYWRRQSRAAGRAYVTPKVVFFDNAHPAFDACSDEAVEGHEYCPVDRTIYLNVGTGDSSSFGHLWATDSNFTIVTIVAHEWGHAIQDQRRASTAGLSQLERELQADCLSGTFARFSASRGWLEVGDLDAAMALALRSGDSSHGQGWQRQIAFEVGYEGSSPAVCELS